MRTPLLHTENLSVGYRHKRHVTTVLSALSLDLYEGELVTILGRNGIGKSTLLRTITGIQLPLAGSVTISGRPLESISARDMSKTVAIVNSERTLAGSLSVKELVALGRHPYTGFFGRLDDVDIDIIDRSLDSVGILDMADRYIASLSDGERQKAMIARALAQSTPVIILDEPTSFLDVASRIETMSLLKSLASDCKKSVLVSSHDVTQALAMSDRLWVISGERTILSGTPAQFLSDTRLLDSMFPGRNVTFDPVVMDFIPR